MTFGEIYNQVCWRMWGDTPPPPAAASKLAGSEGLIANVHRQVQFDYNFWFQAANAVIVTTAGIYAYELPDDIKELTSAIFKSEGNDYHLQPMISLGLTEDISNLWQDDNSVEYPTHFSLVGENIVIYPKPTYSNRDLHVIYWKYLARPTGFTDGTCLLDDVLTVHGYECIINLTLAELCFIMQEFDRGQVFEARGMKKLEELKREDYKRRQAPIAMVKYNRFI